MDIVPNIYLIVFSGAEGNLLECQKPKQHNSRSPY